MFIRRQTFEGFGKNTCFLWGARQTGKSTLLHQRFPRSKRYDLLRSDEFDRLNREPHLLREELLAAPPTRDPIIIDEIQKVPILLDEVHWLMTNTPHRFILCGSSARKLKRGGGNLLGGRALRYELYPLVTGEIPRFDLLRGLNHGFLPTHYLAENPERLIKSYIGDYLKEEIAAEALSRNIPGFGRFMEAAAFSNGEILIYENIARDCGVSAPTVKAYFQILEDTLLGYRVPCYQKRPKRRVIQAPKFYYFDVGLANVLLKRGRILPKSEAFGKALEHFIYQEIVAHRHYSGRDYDLNYWRTASHIEVDFILGNPAVAVEVKATGLADERHSRGLLAFEEEYPGTRLMIVSLDPRPRRMGTVDVLPWKDFLDQLWAGKLL